MSSFDKMSSDGPDSEATLVSPHDETSSDEMSEECDCESCTRSSSTWSSSDGWPASRLPGCSRQDGHSKPWTMTTTMMQAYFAMKGGGTDAKDSLLRFTSKQDERRAQKGGAEGMLSDMFKSIKEQFTCKMHGPATFEEDQRQSVFHYKRANVDHLFLDDSLDRDLLEMIYENHDDVNDGWREVASDISDDEGGPETGRISPCTFACWAEGSKRWDESGDDQTFVFEEREYYEIPTIRQRPPHPNTHEPRVQKRRSQRSLEDEYEGADLTPACSAYAMTEPSILWSPPPMDAKLPASFYNRNFDRMDPNLGKALREGVMSTADSFGFCSTCDSSNVSFEVGKNEENRVIEYYWGLDHIDEEFAKKRRELYNLTKNEEDVNASNERFRHEITRLKHENRKLSDCVEYEQGIRDRRILQQVDRRLRALNFETTAKLAQINNEYKENHQLRQEFSEMKHTHDQLLEYFGMETAEDVFRMFPHVWEPLEYRKNRRNLSG